MPFILWIPAVLAVIALGLNVWAFGLEPRWKRHRLRKAMIRSIVDRMIADEELPY